MIFLHQVKRNLNPFSICRNVSILSDNVVFILRNSSFQEIIYDKVLLSTNKYLSKLSGDM